MASAELQAPTLVLPAAQVVVTDAADDAFTTPLYEDDHDTGSSDNTEPVTPLDASVPLPPVAGKDVFDTSDLAAAIQVAEVGGADVKRAYLLDSETSDANRFALPDEAARGVRSYHEAAGAYVLPADDGELSRLSLQHHLITTHLDYKLVLPPVELTRGAEVLDSGTGTGVWILDTAKLTPPDVNFIGIDISPRLFPQQPPANTTFVEASTLDLPIEWDNKFDLISQRMLLGAFTRAQWRLVLEEFMRVAKPGGWIQLTEGTRHKGGPAADRHLVIMDKLMASRGLFYDVGYHLAEMAKEAGFVNVTEMRRKASLGKWAGELGALSKRNVVSGYRAMKVPVLMSGGFGVVSNEQEFDELLDTVSDELDHTEGSYMEWIACYAQKPLDA